MIIFKKLNKTCIECLYWSESRDTKHFCSVHSFSDKLYYYYFFFFFICVLLIFFFSFSGFIHNWTNPTLDFRCRGECSQLLPYHSEHGIAKMKQTKNKKALWALHYQSATILVWKCVIYCNSFFPSYIQRCGTWNIYCIFGLTLIFPHVPFTFMVLFCVMLQLTHAILQLLNFPVQQQWYG